MISADITEVSKVEVEDIVKADHGDLLSDIFS